MVLLPVNLKDHLMVHHLQVLDKVLMGHLLEEPVPVPLVDLLLHLLEDKVVITHHPEVTQFPQLDHPHPQEDLVLHLHHTALLLDLQVHQAEAFKANHKNQLEELLNIQNYQNFQTSISQSLFLNLNPNPSSKVKAIKEVHLLVVLDPVVQTQDIMEVEHQHTGVELHHMAVNMALHMEPLQGTEDTEKYFNQSLLCKIILLSYLFQFDFLLL